MAMLLMGTDFCHRDTESTEMEIVIVKAPSKEPRNPYQEEYEQMLYPTVRISAGFSTGSGVIIPLSPPLSKGETGGFYILTAAHVVSDQNIVDIEFYNSEIITGTVVITDTINDLALIRITHDAQRTTYFARLAPENYQAYLFTPVWAVGCSLGLKPRPSFGHLSALCDLCGENWEISAPILPGNSGGPVYDAKTYEVIGIAVWVKVYDGQLITTMAGIVPINQIHEFLEPLINTNKH